MEALRHPVVLFASSCGTLAITAPLGIDELPLRNLHGRLRCLHCWNTALHHLRNLNDLSDGLHLWSLSDLLSLLGHVNLLPLTTDTSTTLSMYCIRAAQPVSWRFFARFASASACDAACFCPAPALTDSPRRHRCLNCDFYRLATQRLHELFVVHVLVTFAHLFPVRTEVLGDFLPGLLDDFLP